MAARRRTTSSEYVTPPGLEYFGTHQMPFTDASLATRRSTSSMSGPSAVMVTGIIVMPNASVTPKCLS